MSFKQSARASHIHTQCIFCNLLFKSTTALVCYVGFIIFIHKKHKFGQGGSGLHTLQLVLPCSVQKPLSCPCACVCVLSVSVVVMLACLRFTCCTEHVLHGIYMLLLFVQSRFWPLSILYLHWKKKMAAREVGGQRGSDGQGMGGGGVQVMHFDDSLQVKDE